MLKRTFGNTGIAVSILGFGAGHIGGEDKSDSEVFRLLDAVIDSGINLIDTARGYGLSEERIGKWIRGKKNEVIISTKVGYGIEGIEDWTYECIIKGVEAARGFLSRDTIDIVHLHSCSSWILQNNGVVEALLKCKEEGKIGCAAYSGENEDLQTAMSFGCFDSFQFSYNLFDQNNYESINHLSLSGRGVIIKRPIANAPWRFKTQPFGNYCEEYWLRMKKMGVEMTEDEYLPAAVKFSAFASGVSTIIAGTGSVDHPMSIVKAIEEGDLEAELRERFIHCFNHHQDDWRPQI